MDKDRLTIKQVAELLKVSTDTVRRRIKLKELEAELVVGPYGEQYFLPRSQFSEAMLTKEVVPLTRQVSVADFQAVIQKAIEEAVATATADLKDQVQRLEEKLDSQTEVMDGHYKLVDQRLRQIMERNQQRIPDESRGSLWTRLFSRGG